MLKKIIKHIRQGAIWQATKKYFKNILRKKKKKHNKETESIGFRNNKEEILEGIIPDKYTRLLPYISGQRILDLGAAEGVLSFLLTKTKDYVIALERSSHRHKVSCIVREALGKKGFPVEKCELILGNIDNRPDLLDKVDTVVAIRVIYYFPDVKKTMATISSKVEHIVLGGNEEKVKAYHNGVHNKKTYLATVEGMKSLLVENGYEIKAIVDEGDPIVVGQKKENCKSLLGDIL